jgi:hypothetical protein
VFPVRYERNLDIIFRKFSVINGFLVLMAFSIYYHVFRITKMLRYSANA